MRELNKQDMIDVLYGCAVLGTGGGGSRLAWWSGAFKGRFRKGKNSKIDHFR